MSMFKINDINQLDVLSIDIMEVLSPYWELAKHVVSNDDLSARLQVKVEENNERLYNAVFSDYCKELLTKVFSKDNLDKYASGGKLSEILLIYIADTQLYVLLNRKIGTENIGSTHHNSNIVLSKFLRSKILAEFLNTVGEQKLACLLPLDNDDFYNNTLTHNDISSDSLKNAVYQSSFFKFNDNIEQRELSDGILWLNVALIKDNFGLVVPAENPLLVYQKEETELLLAILVGDILFCFNTAIEEYVDDTKKEQMLWWNISTNAFRVYFKNERKDEYLTKNFLEKAKADNSFLNQLSKLTHNLYLDGKVELNENYSEFFSPIVLFDKMDGANVNQELYVADNNDHKPYFGIYNVVRNQDDTHFKLRHYYESGEKLSHWESLEKKNTNVKKPLVNILKPQYAYYFVEYFFEDYLFAAISDVCKEFEFECTFNYKAEMDNGNLFEHDAIVFTRKKFWFVEAKTNLDLQDINKFANRAHKILTNLDGYDVDFLIVGCFSKKELALFKDIEEKQGYNKIRDNLNYPPYFFHVGIPESDQKVTCFTEPYYDNLKGTLSSVLKS